MDWEGCSLDADLGNSTKGTCSNGDQKKTVSCYAGLKEDVVINLMQKRAQFLIISVSVGMALSKVEATIQAS